MATDIAYVVDVVMDRDGTVSLNEINAASTSGMYQVSLDVSLALRSATIREFAGELIKE